MRARRMAAFELHLYVAMAIFLVFLLACVVVVQWLLVRARVRRVEQQMAILTARVFALESPKKAAEEPAPLPVAVTGATPTAAAPDAVGVTMPRPQATEVPRVETERTVTPRRPPSPSFGERMRKRFGDAEWEALVGGSLLNKMGALVLVIGIALFLGYSFTHMTPSGRALTSLAASLALLGGGVLLERKQTYRIFARGLIGAGWAALYVTGYAIYAVPAARLISNPLLGSLLLLCIAAGMIAHSLRYRSQGVTSVAYFAAFAALGVTPWSVFAVVSLIPLAASLLYLAERFRWNAMAVFGVFATYATCIWRGSSGASLAAAQSLLLVYWVLFEGFDLLRARRGVSGGVLAAVFPLNAIGFLMLSYSAWVHHNPAHLWEGYAFAAALYLASAVARYVMVGSALRERDFAARLKAGTFEAPTTFATFLAGLSIAGRATGVWLGAGLALEAEILYAAGVWLNSIFLRSLAGVGFACSLGRLLVNDFGSDEVLTQSARPVHNWVPPALFQAALFYLNRVLRRPNVMFSSIAAGLVAAVLAEVLPVRAVGMGWLVFAAVLFEVGLRRRAREFRFQAYVLALGGIVLAASEHLMRVWTHSWIPAACGLGFLYALLFRARNDAALPESERKGLRIAVAPAITGMAVLLVMRLSPHGYRGMSLCVLALVLFELGWRKLPRTLAPYSLLVAAGGALAVSWDSSRAYEKFGPMHVWLSYAGTALCFYVLGERSGDYLRQLRAVLTSVAIAFALCTIWLVAPDRVVAPLWALLGLILFYAGQKRPQPTDRWQSYAVMLAAVVNAWLNDFRLSSIAVAAVCFAAQFLSPREGQRYAADEFGIAESSPRIYWALLGTFVVTALLWVHFPGGWMTTAWGIEGLALLGAGFPLRERVLRLAGLGLLLVCILKLFLYDLRNLETVYRILSFVALGLILLGVSSIYTRFRERVKRLL